MICFDNADETLRGLVSSLGTDACVSHVVYGSFPHYGVFLIITGQQPLELVVQLVNKPQPLTCVVLCCVVLSVFVRYVTVYQERALAFPGVWRGGNHSCS